MTSRPKIRDDFIRRLFAVAISVGFASTLIAMDWVRGASWPSPTEQQQLGILFIGLFATVASWDGYLASIEAKPLLGDGRFMIDITLVFIYMFFLISSKTPAFWLPILAIIYSLYTIWDALSAREHFHQYDADVAQSDRLAGAGAIGGIYVRGFLNAPKVDRGPIITLSWLAYFCGLVVLGSQAFPDVLYKVGPLTLPAKFVLLGPLAFTGLLLYRADKRARQVTRPIGTAFRLFSIALLLAGGTTLYWLVATWP